jgi:hypothetical protein
LCRRDPPGSLFESGPIPTAAGKFDQRRPLIDKAMDIVDSKYTGPQAISAVIGALDMLNDTARFIPGYAGANDLFYGDRSWQRGVGALLLVSDAIPLLGSVRNASRMVRAGSQSFIVVGAGTRIVDGIKTSLEGNAGLGTGVDVSFAVIESTLYAISRVKVRVRLSGTAASSEVSDVISDIARNGDLNAYGQILVPDEASARRLAEVLASGRSAADIRSRGLTPDELIELIAANPNQTRTQIRARQSSVADTTSSNGRPRDAVGTSSRRSINPCAGLSLTADDLCELARVAPNERKTMRKEMASRTDAFTAAKRESGGYFGEMTEITPLYTDPSKPAKANVGYSELRGARNADGTPVYTREYWFRNADHQIVVIQEHSLGHPGLTNGEKQHFNVRHISKEAKNNPSAIRDALDSAPPPPNLPAVGHYDFGTVN